MTVNPGSPRRAGKNLVKPGRRRRPNSRSPGGEERPVPPEELKPWYYQYWFLYPTIVFWPLWSVLIIRSPWHNGLISGVLAWAYLIIFAGLAYVRIQQGGTIALEYHCHRRPGAGPYRRYAGPLGQESEPHHKLCPASGQPGTQHGSVQGGPLPPGQPAKGPATAVGPWVSGRR